MPIGFLWIYLSIGRNQSGEIRLKMHSESIPRPPGRTARLVRNMIDRIILTFRRFHEACCRAFKRDDEYRGDRLPGEKAASRFLVDNIHLLPKGRALDIAAGEGRNSVFLAQHGFKVEAIDISEAGLEKAKKLAQEKGVEVTIIETDLETYQIKEKAYNLIANFNYLQRGLIPQIKKGLKKGGAVIFETYLIDQRNLPFGPKNPDYLLEHNELLGFFKGFRIILYREGVYSKKGREKAIASIIAVKQ